MSLKKTRVPIRPQGVTEDNSWPNNDRDANKEQSNIFVTDDSCDSNFNTR